LVLLLGVLTTHALDRYSHPYRSKVTVRLTV
jgi:hypothetical protein